MLSILRSFGAALSLGATMALGAATPAAMAQTRTPMQQDQKAHAADDSGTMKRADRDMQKVLQKLQDLGAKPIGTMSVEATRKQPTPADAVKAVLADEKKGMPAPKVKKQDVTYPAGAGQQPARIYTPEAADDRGGSQGQNQGMPVIVYYHGGGWVIADLDTYEASAIALAEQAKAIVVSVEYRHAPENKFPAAHQDSFAAYKWVIENAEQWGGDPRRIAVAGESAGGNLAINTAIMARDQKVQMPVHMLLVYPVAGVDMNTDSYQKNANAMPLSKAAMAWFVQQVLAKPDDKNSPMLDLVGKANLKGLPSATVITAEIDPLMSEGKMLADKLKDAGSKVKYENYSGVTHEFFGMAAVVGDAKKAQDVAAGQLRDTFKNTPPEPQTGSTR